LNKDGLKVTAVVQTSKIEKVNVGARNPDNVKVYYCVEPTDSQIDFSVFIAPRNKETKTNLSKDFFSTFNDHYFKSNNNLRG